jgi:site-specific DNA-methyltransferase (adenine-specific)
VSLILGNSLDKIKDTIENKSIDLILTDPPYIISRDSGMDQFHEFVQNKEEFVKTEKDWLEYKLKNPSNYSVSQEDNFLRYGTIYGDKYAVKTKFGSWDDEFTLDILDEYIKLFYEKLVDGGTCVIFFDIWKLSYLKEIMEKYKFKQIRFLEWIKTNPQPRNSKINYLTNCREIALLGIKKSNPTFNSQYDNAIYKYPFPSGKGRIHPTQKSLPLFIDLVKKHSNENDVVLDPFMGSGTACVACIETNRKYIGIERDEKYYQSAKKRIERLYENKLR